MPHVTRHFGFACEGLAQEKNYQSQDQDSNPSNLIKKILAIESFGTIHKYSQQSLATIAHVSILQAARVSYSNRSLEIEWPIQGYDCAK
jgi:hypothetical protein